MKMKMLYEMWKDHFIQIAIPMNDKNEPPKTLVKKNKQYTLVKYTIKNEKFFCEYITI